jgi:predicted dienelactone hydrolase
MRTMEIRRAALAVLPFALACSSSKPAAAPPPPAPVAPAASELARSGLDVVLDADISLKDSSRNRDLAVRVTYPEGPGPFPVIVFSHGAGGSARTHDALARFWATHGFVVLAPNHADPGAGGKDPAGESVREPAGDAAADPKGWETRARDLAFVAAATGAVEARVPALKGKLDDARVGMGGQSYGAFAAMLVAGAAVEVSKKDKLKSFADPIPKAFLFVSPPGKGQQGLTEKSWAAVERPVMVVTGTRDVGPKGQDPSWRLDSYQLSPPGGKYAVFIEGASHLSFTGLAAEPGSAPPKSGKKTSADAEVAIFRDLKIATLAFWEGYLKDDANSKAFLQTDALMTESENRAQLLRR